MRDPQAVELTAKRTANGKHHRNPDGTLSAEFATGAIHYQDAVGGAWKDKAPGFRATGTANEYISDASDVVMRTFQVGTGGNRRWWVEFTEKLTGTGIRFELQFQPTPDATDPARLNFTSPEGQWSYTHTLAGGKMLGPSTATSAGTRTYSFRYELLGGAPALAQDPDGTVYSGNAFRMAPPHIAGADGKAYAQTGWSIDSATQTLTWTYTDTGLPPSAYPYRIDPTTAFAISAAGNDTYAEKIGAAYPPAVTNPTWDPTTAQVQAGRSFLSPNFNIRNAYLKWDTSSLGAGATVTGSTLQFAATGSNANARNIVGAWQSWTKITADWSDTPPASPILTITVATAITAGTHTATITDWTGISLTGTTYLWLAVDGGQPAGENYANIVSFEAAGTPKPTLNVDYTVPNPQSRQAASATASGTGTSATINKQTGTATGDSMSATVAFQGGTGVTITATGWSLVDRRDSGTDIGLATYSKVAGASESAETWTLSGSQQWVSACESYYLGSGSTPVLDVADGQANTSSTSIAAPQVTTAAVDELLKFVGAIASGQAGGIAPAAGMTELADVQTGSGAGGSAAAKTLYFLDAAASGGGDLMDMQDGGTAPTLLTMGTTGWVCGTNAAPNYCDMDRATIVARTASDATYGWKTTAPTSPVNSTRGNACRTPTPLSGTFASANWTYSWVPRLSSANTAQRGSLRFRLFHGTAADGSNATEITAGAAEAGPMTAAASTASATAYTVTVNPGAFTLTNEYLFFVLCYRVTTAGGATSSNILLTTGTNSKIVTSTFTPDLNLALEVAQEARPTAGATGTRTAVAATNAAVSVASLMALAAPSAAPASLLYSVDIRSRSLLRR